MLRLRRSTTFGDGHTTRESNPGQSSNLARNNKILTGLLARRKITVLAGVTGLFIEFVKKPTANTLSPFLPPNTFVLNCLGIIII